MLHRRIIRQAARDSQATILGVSITCLFLFFPTTNAQSSIDIPTTAPSLSPPASTTTTSAQASVIISSSSPSMTTSFTTSTSSNSTTSSASPKPTEFTPPELFPAASHADPDNLREETVFNYYFLFLAAFGLLVMGGLWWLHRRRKRRKEQMRLSGQNALAQDLDGWISTRRWMHAAWRYHQTAAFIRREEGLNEHGEAPPPYQPKTEVVLSHDGSDAVSDGSTGLTIPMRTLSREEAGGGRPPEYNETLPLPTDDNARHQPSETQSIYADTVATPSSSLSANHRNCNSPPPDPSTTVDR